MGTWTGLDLFEGCPKCPEGCLGVPLVGSLDFNFWGFYVNHNK